ncbi:MAG: hypothetical protein ACR2GK_11125, partial [Gemmatimonadaceae bacterium]
MLSIPRVVALAVALSVVAAGCSRRSSSRQVPTRVNTDSLLREQARLDSMAREEAARNAAAAAAG